MDVDWVGDVISKLNGDNNMSYETIKWQIPSELLERLDRWDMHDSLAEFTANSWEQHKLEAAKILQELLWISKHPTENEQKTQIRMLERGF